MSISKGKKDRECFSSCQANLNDTGSALLVSRDKEKHRMAETRHL